MGGLAIKNTSKIPAKTAEKLGNDIVSVLSSKLGIDRCILGSVGTKPDDLVMLRDRELRLAVDLVKIGQDQHRLDIFRPLREGDLVGLDRFLEPVEP